METARFSVSALHGILALLTTLLAGCSEQACQAYVAQQVAQQRPTMVSGNQLVYKFDIGVFDNVTANAAQQCRARGLQARLSSGLNCAAASAPDPLFGITTQDCVVTFDCVP